MLDIRKEDLPPYTGRINNYREDLYGLFAKLGYSCGAEIGVKWGRNSKEMFNRIPGLKLICVDPWHKTDKGYGWAKGRLENDNVVWKRMTSMEAVGTVSDNSLDFVYIDGLHDFDNVMLDLIYWSQKIRVGGIISGHDYYYSQTCHVPRAVDAYVLAHGINDLYLTRDNIGRGKSPHTPSFFWVKGK